ncbi:acyl-CoA dehydrogenase family protein [Nitriliruptor alkaliphilus]|uniref:acyl-CoA dehydrogenase family protein n=1 Tax=Nitriliruptor alkaliphilus TaxID=427918 RepID=UPI0006970243|nr:acyl-CoA dehydrogenase family protein [Nitriliruptor alkaliphilus]
MDLSYTADELAFRDELRAWLAATLPDVPAPPDVDDWAGRRAYDTAWQRRLFDAGYAGLDWPQEAGGRALSPTEHLIFLEETERAGAPYVGVNFVGLLHAGPTLAAEGTAEQRARHLPAILRGDEVWCQGFSEPDAGSDLASLRARAVRDGDEYVVTGRKIWSTFAHVADVCELLVRTDPDAPKHRGISWLICPMDAPGIEVRPLETIAGSSEFCEVVFDEVRVPVEHRVGEANDGWRVAMVTFSFERGTAFVSELLQTRQAVAALTELARELPLAGGGKAWDDGGVRREIAHLAAEFDALWALTKRNVTQAARTGAPGIGGSVWKLAYSEARHRLGDLAMRLLGPAGLALDDLGDVPGGEHVRGWFHAMSISIAAGTSQIQRNIVGERILGLPKEPR